MKFPSLHENCLYFFEALPSLSIFEDQGVISVGDFYDFLRSTFTWFEDSRNSKSSTIAELWLTLIFLTTIQSST